MVWNIVYFEATWLRTQAPPFPPGEDKLRRRHLISNPFNSSILGSPLARLTRSYVDAVRRTMGHLCFASDVGWKSSRRLVGDVCKKESSSNNFGGSCVATLMNGWACSTKLKWFGWCASLQGLGRCVLCQRLIGCESTMAVA